MKIVVIGGSGLIGTKLVHNLRQSDHEVLAASRSTGVNTVTGEGLTEALSGTQVVVDVANAPSWEDEAVLAFFETAGATFSPQKWPPALNITWRFRSSEPSGSLRAVTSARSWPRKT